MMKNRNIKNNYHKVKLYYKSKLLHDCG